MKRQLSIDVTMAEDQDYAAALTLAKRAGAGIISLSLPFDELETAPGKFEPATDFRKIANDFFPSFGVEVTLVLSVIDTMKSRLPMDLQDKPFDHPEVVQRFTALLDDTFAKIPKLSLSSLAIGNEIDAYLGRDRAKWTAYRRFFAATAAHARKKRPGIKVGTKITFAGLTRESVEEAQLIQQHADVLMATYYPLNSDFTVQPTSVVAKDFRTLAAISRKARKPLYVLECGYPSDKACKSSEAAQAEFVRSAFAAWDTEAEAIPVVSMTWLTDLPTNDVDALTKYYGFQTPSFVAYLASLGLRKWAGKGLDKAAYIALKEEARRRSFIR